MVFFENASSPQPRAGAKRRRGEQGSPGSTALDPFKIGQDGYYETCVLCHDGAPDAANPLITCDKQGCDLAYHPDCLNNSKLFPTLKNTAPSAESLGDESQPWVCPPCSTQNIPLPPNCALSLYRQATDASGNWLPLKGKPQSPPSRQTADTAPPAATASKQRARSPHATATTTDRCTAHNCTNSCGRRGAAADHCRDFPPSGIRGAKRRPTTCTQYSCDFSCGRSPDGGASNTCLAYNYLDSQQDPYAGRTLLESHPPAATGSHNGHGQGEQQAAQAQHEEVPTRTTSVLLRVLLQCAVLHGTTPTGPADSAQSQ